MNPTYDFTAQVALVTDAASGMGLATAQAFAEAGAAVVLADVDEQTLRMATGDLTALGRRYGSAAPVRASSSVSRCRSTAGTRRGEALTVGS